MLPRLAGFESYSGHSPIHSFQRIGIILCIFHGSLPSSIHQTLSKCLLMHERDNVVAISSDDRGINNVLSSKFVALLNIIVGDQEFGLAKSSVICLIDWPNSPTQA